MENEHKDKRSNRKADPFSRLLFNQHRYVAAQRCLVSIDGKETRLRAKTRQVFEQLASTPNEVVSREELVQKIWGDVFVTDDALSQSIREIRRALDDTDRTVLETLPKQGYLLHATEADFTNNLSESGHSSSITQVTLFGSLATAFFLFFVCIYLIKYLSTDTIDSASNTGKISDNLSVLVKLADSPATDPANRLVKEVVTALSHYSSITPTIKDNGTPDYKLELSLYKDDASHINFQLHHVATEQLVLADNLRESLGEPVNAPSTADRIAALIGSPAGGAIGHHLLKNARGKTANELTRPECLAHGYGCTSCAGDTDSIVPVALQCLANLLQENPQDPDAWAMQSSVYARQYLWGSALQEPMRSNKAERTHLKASAIQAATHAEELSNGNNPSVFWGSMHAHLASCDVEKMKPIIERGLRLTPNDSNLLAVYGNYLSFAGEWDEGKALVDRAHSMEPHFFKRWWFMGPAKWHYRQGDYQEAYDLFIQGFDERNWLSHLQLAYTLPHLARFDEAKQSLGKLKRMAPGLTLEHVIDFYKGYCFEDEFIAKVRTALELIGMPSRPFAGNANKSIPIGATVIDLNNRKFEYVDVGKGTPIIFVHGSFSDYRTWAYMKNPVSRNNRFIAYTLKHFGTQHWPSDKVTYDFYEDEKELIEFIEYLDIGQVTLVGWSRGVQPAIMVARKRPELVSKLVLYEGIITGLDANDAPEVSPTPQKKAQVAEMESAVEQQNYAKAVVPLFEIALQYPPNSFEMQPAALQQVVLENARTLTQLFANDADNQPEFNCQYYSSINTPTIVVHGDRTDPHWQFESESMANCMPNASLAVLENATHDGPLSQPEKLAELIDNFISGE